MNPAENVEVILALSNNKEEKTFSGQITCKCKRDCANTIDILRQKDLFDEFYSLETWQDRTIFLRHLVTGVKKEHEYLNPLVQRKKKKYEYIYSLEGENGDVHQVCLSFFAKLFQLNSNTIRNAVRSAEYNPEGVNLRGKFPKRKVPKSDFEFVRHFIGEFQTYEASYRSRKLYLHPKLGSLLQLYKQYKNVCAFKKRKKVSRAYFNKIFKRDFSLGFPPKGKLKNCSECRTIKRSMLRPISRKLRSKWQLRKTKHINLVQNINKKFITDITEARFVQSHVEILTFEVCPSFDLPSLLQNDLIMRARQLWQFVMLIHDEIRDHTHIYTWPESVASKGSSEITSCIRKYVTDNLPADTETLILYGDPRSGQNRNSKISLMLIDLLHSWPHNSLKAIEQRFFMEGHARNKCNVQFSLIQKQKKVMQNIFCPKDCVELIKSSKNTNPRFLVNEMQSRQFLSLDPLVDLFNSSEIKEIDFSKIQTIIHDREDPLTIKCRAYDWAPSVFVSFKINVNNMENFPVITLPLLYPEGRAISKAKYDDLQDLAKYIPAEYQEFYKNLNFESTANLKDFALSLKESSDEEN